MADDTDSPSPPEITIKMEWCKGCGYCVEYCPTDTLVMNGAEPVVNNADSCTVCMLCDYMCPDFCITVRGVALKKKKRKAKPSAQPSADGASKG